MAMLLDGKAQALRIRDKIKNRVGALSTQPGLAVILVGDDPASHTYVALKQDACEEAGIYFEKFLYSAEVEEGEIIKKVRELNTRKDIHGILVQLPLPNQDANNVIPEIDPLKDVDGFHKENLERLRRGEPAIASAVALGVMKLISTALEHYPKGVNRTAVIVASVLFSEPIEILLKEHNLPTTVIQAESDNLAEVTKSADILIVAEGIPGLITGDMVKPGAIVIDVGTTRVDGKLMGDVEEASVEKIAGALTPVPGGVGPMTVAMLLVNILKAYGFQLRIDK
ncbi:MAG: bifunctional 5,10-methylenetetrahydrofolate dehydrogenase/5,10-methenyltetrahydrofolate cyclohydrolase [Parcubacteria group bacterium]|nr:bifunctional 5,10-methylenetetrahydrofolate dehydrogenase/5,10-methenyltetrahydrofolate cyclohydrolase [Parcubacteria group bacterium]